MTWIWTRRNSKNARIEANEPHLSDVSAEDLGTDSPGADKDVKESQLIRNQLRDSLEEQVFTSRASYLFLFAVHFSIGLQFWLI